jgi:hypothetical protein
LLRRLKYVVVEILINLFHIYSCQMHFSALWLKTYSLPTVCAKYDRWQTHNGKKGRVENDLNNFQLRSLPLPPSLSIIFELSSLKQW